MDYFQLYLSAAAAIALLIFLDALFNISSKLKSIPKRLPPEPAGAWPVIGHLHLLTATEPAHITFSKLADTYGPIFTLRLGMHKAIIVSNWEIAKECFTTNDKIFASRPKLVASKLLGYNYTMLGLSPYGAQWRHVRKIATLKLLTNHRLQQLNHVRVSEVENSMKKLYEQCTMKKRELVDMKKWFGDVTLNIIVRVVVGKRFSTAVEGEDEEYYKKALRDFFEWFGVFVPSDWFPFLKWFDFGGHEKGMKKTAKVLDLVFDKWLEEHRLKSNEYGEVMMMMDGHDFMDVMLCAVRDDDELSSYDGDIVTKSTCLALILAGFDTTTITMIWALSLLLNNQESLKKAQLELDQQIGRQQRQVKESDIKNLPYLQAIVKETLRLYPAGPLAIPHESTQDCTISGYYIPARTRLMVNIQKLQRDPRIWEDPCEFRPERFLATSTRKDLDVRGQSPELIPFGSGRRMCPGISFALQILHLTLANLVHGFEIHRPFEDELLNMEESGGMTSIRKDPLEVFLTPRLQSHVYDFGIGKND